MRRGNGETFHDPLIDPHMTYVPARGILGLISFVSAIMQEDIG